MEPYSIKSHYLDASALVKLIADDVEDEPGRDVLRKYFAAFPKSFMYSTSYCFVEALSVLKRKMLTKRIDWLTYCGYVKELLLYRTNRFQIDEVDAYRFLEEADRLMQKFEKEKLDFVDCLQIVTLRHGKFSIFVGPSSPVLITADRALAAAATAEKVIVWECTSQPPPPTPH